MFPDFDPPFRARSGHPGAAPRRARPIPTRPIPFALLLTLLSQGIALAQTDGDGPLRRLAERLMGPYAYVDFRTELLPEALPDDLPVPLPLPPGSELVGTLAQRDLTDTLRRVQVVIDSDLAPNEVLTFYLAAFDEIGWQGLPENASVGFLHPFTTIGAGICSPGEGSGWISTFAAPGSATDVRVDINIGAEYAYCPAPDGTSYPSAPETAPLPALAALPGTTVAQHGLTLMPDQSSSSALIGEVPADVELHGHYAAQLVASGWRLEEIVASDGAGTTVSRWLDADGAWEALLSLGSTPAGIFASLIVVAP